MSRSTRALVAAAALFALAPAATAQETDAGHQVRKGDTLWDLAARYLSDPYRWSDIYELNSNVVEDPHWIFPGEVLRLPGMPEGTSIDRVPAERVTNQVEYPAAADGERRAPTEQGGTTQQATGVGEFPASSVFRQPRTSRVTSSLSLDDVEPRPAVSMSDFYGSSLIARKTELQPIGTTSRVVAESSLGRRLPTAARPHNQVIITLTGLGVEVGDDLQAVRWGRRIADAGHALRSMAHVRVTRVHGDSARGEVIRIFDDYRVGDLLIPVEPFPLTPGVAPEPEAAGPVGVVLGFEVDQTLVGRGEKLFINLGSVDGVQPGDEFAVFSSGEATPSDALFEDRLSVVRVLRTTEATATAMVIEVRDPGMQPGAPVRRVKQMPRQTP